MMVGRLLQDIVSHHVRHTQCAYLYTQLPHSPNFHPILEHLLHELGHVYFQLLDFGNPFSPQNSEFHHMMHSF